mgnify:CR=1 FL=1
MRRGISMMLRVLPAHLMDRGMKYLPPRLRYPALGDRLNKLGSVLSSAEGISLYRALISQFQDPTLLALEAHEPETLLARSESWPSLDDFLVFVLSSFSFYVFFVFGIPGAPRLTFSVGPRP